VKQKTKGHEEGLSKNGGGKVMISPQKKRHSKETNYPKGYCGRLGRRGSETQEEGRDKEEESSFILAIPVSGLRGRCGVR